MKTTIEQDGTEYRIEFTPHPGHRDPPAIDIESVEPDDPEFDYGAAKETIAERLRERHRRNEGALWLT